jgi:hypothetical protein
VTQNMSPGIYLVGVQATGYIGVPAVLSQIVPGQNPNWGPTVPNQNPNWGPVSPTQTPSWAPNVPSQNPSWGPITPGG